jgi:hypothetical protein
MELINATKMEADYTMGLQPDGRELIVVVVKGTFTIPEHAAEPHLADVQVPLFMADVFTGEPGFSAPLYEIDFALRKPRCDVLLIGKAYAPGHQPAKRVRVSLRIGPIAKSIDVVGNRVWKKRFFFITPTRPEPFTIMPISYDNAFGGIDNTHQKETRHSTYLTNHVGVGFHRNLKAKFVHNKPLPNTEEPGKRIRKPNGTYHPMAFGSIARAWQPRVKLAGTYDQKWLDDTFPFLPEDFRDDYYQAAPPDQRMDYPTGGEEVELINLTKGGYTHFKLPTIKMSMQFFYKGGGRKAMNGNIDTLLFEPELGRFTMSWRCCVLLRKNIFEIDRVVVGDKPRSWYREVGLLPSKRHFRSLAELAQWSRERGRTGR